MLNTFDLFDRTSERERGGRGWTFHGDSVYGFWDDGAHVEKTMDLTKTLKFQINKIK